MELIATVKFIQEHISLSRIAYGQYRVVVCLPNQHYTNITTFRQAYERIVFDDYLPACVHGTGGLTLIQAYHAILSEIQIKKLNTLYNETKSKS